MYNQGIASLADILHTGVRLGVLDKSGSWYQYAGQKIGQGTEASVAYLKENSKTSLEIVEGIKKKFIETQTI